MGGLAIILGGIVTYLYVSFPPNRLKEMGVSWLRDGFLGRALSIRLRSWSGSLRDWHSAPPSLARMAAANQRCWSRWSQSWAKSSTVGSPAYGLGTKCHRPHRLPVSYGCSCELTYDRFRGFLQHVICGAGEAFWSSTASSNYPGTHNMRFGWGPS